MLSHQRFPSPPSSTDSAADVRSSSKDGAAVAGKSHVIVGDGALAIRCAERLLAKGHRIAVFVSRYPKTRAWAEQHGIPTAERPSRVVSALGKSEIDCLFSIVNDDILPTDLLDLPKLAAINFHDGPLPRYVGVHATSWAIIHGEKEHGVTWHRMSDEVDAGDILAQAPVEILPEDTALTLNSRCLEAAVALFETLIEDLEHLAPTRQDLSQRTLFHRHQRPPAACVLDFNRPAIEVANLVRALDFGHHPNTLGRAKVAIEGRVFVVEKAECLHDASDAEPGTIVDVTADGLVVATADRNIRIRCQGSPASVAIGAKAALDDEPRRALDERGPRLARSEKFWSRRLAALQPLQPPYMRSAAPAGTTLTIDQPLPANFTTEQVIAAFHAYLCRLGEGTHIAFGVDGIPNLVASEVPFAPKNDLALDLAACTAATSEELAGIRKRDSYLLDLRLRMPELRKLPDAPLPVGVYVGSTDRPTSRLRLRIEPDATACRWIADSAVIDLADLVRMREQFELFLAGIAAAPACPLSDVSPLSSSPFLDESHPEIVADAPLHRIFERQAARTPDATALTFEESSLTYRELNSRANALARHLRDSHGIAPDTLVGICCERDMDVVIGILAILKAGGAYLPIDLAYPANRLAFMLEDSKAPVLITQRRLASRLPNHDAAVVFVDEIDLSADTANLEGGAGLDDLAYVIFTSGSTGRPKGAQITHRNVVRLMRATEHWFGFDHNDVWTLFHSYAFDFSVWELWGPLFYGGRLVVVPFHVSRSPGDFYRLLSREKVTVLNQTPSAFRQLIRAEEESGALPLALRYVIFGGEALEMQSLRPWFDRHGDRQPTLVNMYGITETTVHVTYRPLSAADLDSGSVIGEPIPDLHIHILDQNQNPVPIGIPGEMYVSGAGLARGYLNRDQLTAERFVTKNGIRLYRTGDVARFLPDGDLEYLGRCDDQVKIRGFRIELGEIESVLCQHAAIREACVLAREDTPGDKRLVGYVVTKTEAPTVAELREHLLRSVPDYMVPAAFVFLDRFPLTNNGKTDRKALPAPGSERADLGTDFVAPANETEHTLCSIWQKTLKLDNIGTHDNFFELGGDSILGIQIVARARQAGLAITPKHLFDFPTIAELAAHCGDVSRQCAAPVSSDPIPLTPIQEWFFEQQLTNPGHYNQSFLLDCRTPLDPAKLQRALVTVVNHHDALRLRFENGIQTYGPPVSTVPTDGSAVFDLAAGCLLHARYDADRQQLFLAVHHLAIDGVSWRILLEDLESAYLGRPLPQKSASFAEWSAALRNYAVPPEERHYWNTIESSERRAASLESETRSITLGLDPDETTRLLREAPAAHGVRIHGLLLAALARATGEDNLLVDTEGHGREAVIADLDVSRTIGWFTSIYPVRLDASEVSQLSEIPHNGVGYGILRYLGESPEAKVDPDVIFNYLGQFDEVVADSTLFAFAEEQTVPWHAPENARRHELEITCLIRNGRFEVTFVYAHRSDEEVESTASRFLDSLRQFLGREETFPLAPCRSSITRWNRPARMPVSTSGTAGSAGRSIPRACAAHGRPRSTAMPRCGHLSRMTDRPCMRRCPWISASPKRPPHRSSRSSRKMPRSDLT